MILTSLVWLACALAPQPATTSSALAPVQEEEQGPSYEDRLAAAGDDAAALWELHLWCRSQHKYSESRKALKKIVELAPEHEEARSALGHTFYDDRWFESSYKLSEYKRAEEKTMLEEKGLVRFGDEWVPKEDASYLRMGWIKSDSGAWQSKLAATRAATAERLSSEGWKQQTDLVWVSPEEQGNWEKGLWKCGEDWVSAEEANAFHTDINTPWRWPTKYFELYSTLDLESLSWAAWWVDQTYADLVRAYGQKPKQKPVVTVLSNIPQYNLLAQGDQASGRPPTENNGYSSCHYAYVGEGWFDTTEADPNDLASTVEYLGGGICYWDRQNPDLAAYGQHAVRHAAALSYAETIDPSWDAVSKFVANPSGQGINGFWVEKRIPRWLRFGVASYCERFFKDLEPAEGYSEWWARDWALDNIRREGGPRAFEEIFAFNLDPNDQKGSAKLIAEAGMIVSFVLDGNCAPVIEKHQALRMALREGGDTQAALEELQNAIIENDEPFHYHVGM